MKRFLKGLLSLAVWVLPLATCLLVVDCAGSGWSYAPGTFVGLNGARDGWLCEGNSPRTTCNESDRARAIVRLLDGSEHTVRYMWSDELPAGSPVLVYVNVGLSGRFLYVGFARRLPDELSPLPESIQPKGAQ